MQETLPAGQKRFLKLTGVQGETWVGPLGCWEPGSLMSYQVAECHLPGQQHRSCLCTLGALASARLQLQGQGSPSQSRQSQLSGARTQCVPRTAALKGVNLSQEPPGTDGDVQSHPDSHGALTRDSEP